MIDTVPAGICATAVHGTGDGDVEHPSLQRASGPNDLMMGAHQKFDGTNTDNKESSDADGIPTDSIRVILLNLLWNKSAAPTPKGRLQWVQILRAIILGRIFSLLHLGMRVTDHQCECNEQTCR